MKAIQAATIAYEYRWNYVRRTKALLRQTPVETINNAFVFALAFLKVVKDRYNPETNPFLRLLGNGAIVCQTDVPKKSHSPKNKTKQISVVNRYLQYVKWDESNCVLPLSPIFLNYSLKL